MRPKRLKTFDYIGCYHYFMRQRSSRAAKALQGIRLWQDGYFERVLRDDEQLEVAAQYIFENPVRAGLVGDSLDWRYCGGRLAVVCALPELELGPTYAEDCPS